MNYYYLKYGFLKFISNMGVSETKGIFRDRMFQTSLFFQTLFSFSSSFLSFVLFLHIQEELDYDK